MAESNGQEKTEQPTGKRREDARKKGNVFQSQDVANVVLLFTSFTMLKFYIPSIFRIVREYMTVNLSQAGQSGREILSWSTYYDFCESALRCVLPLLLATIIFSVIAHGSQTRFLVSFQKLRPGLDKLNPLSGIKRMFELKNAIKLLSSLVKAILLTTLLYMLLKNELARTARMIDMAPVNSAAYTLDTIYSLVRSVCIAFAVVAFFDFLYQRWDYENNLKMTKQEVKDEYKQTEGNPEIKGRIKKMQRQMSMNRMIQKVPEADVIIRNPTHLAIALRYDPNRDRAPVVLAKGQDELALRIVRVGMENNVAVIENKAVARAMYPLCELDREIPPEFYGTVAEILVYIYRAAGKEDLLK